MTLREAIERFDVLYPNILDYSAKRKVISDLDGKIYLEIHSNYENCCSGFGGYTENTPGDTLLIALFPFDDIYIKALCAENDAVTGDINRYNNSAALFNAAWEQYAAYYNRVHSHKNGNIKY